MNKSLIIFRRLLLVVHHSTLIILLTGCGALGVVADRIADKKIKAQYAGLAGHSTAVMVWADRAAKIEWPSIQLDLANQIQTKLYANTAEELKGTTWPWQPNSVARYQVEHPGIEGMPITDVAPKLHVERLVYVEIEQFSTRAETYQMYRGNVVATLKIVEVNGADTKIAYEEGGIRANFPPKSGPEGVLNANDATIYRGTIAALSQAIVDRLATREPD